MSYVGQSLTNEMNDCKNELELLKLGLIKENVKSSDLLEAKMTYLVNKLDTKSAINPLSIFHLTWETQVSAMATVFSYLIVLINFKLMSV